MIKNFISNFINVYKRNIMTWMIFLELCARLDWLTLIIFYLDVMLEIRLSVLILFHSGSITAFF